MIPFVYQCQPYPSYAYSALPSPPLSYPSKLAHLIDSPHSSTTSPSKNTCSINKTNLPLLPSIHHIVLPPLSPSNNTPTSPDSTSSSTFLSYSYYSPSPTSAPQQRNGSIQSLLNSDPELKRLDEEEYKCGYQSHFMTLGVKRKKSHPHSLDSIKKTKSYNINSNKRYNTTSSCSSIIMSSSSTKGGLRHFSKQVCDKVKAHGITTYDQVVHEITCDLASPWFDEKNIRRRVYDTVNVLMAMDIIAKVKKEIKWLGIPSCYQHDIDDGRNMGLLLDADDSFYVQQIRAEEARKKDLLSSISTTRINIRNSLTKYLQLRRLIHRNQHQSSNDPTLPFTMTDTDMDDYCNKSLVYSAISDDSILSDQFNHPFTTQEISAWLPDSSWYHYIDLNAS